MYFVAVDQGRAPRIAHPTPEAAEAEAERLAKTTNRNVSVYLLVSVIKPPVEPQQGGQHGLV